MESFRDKVEAVRTEIPLDKLQDEVRGELHTRAMRWVLLADLYMNGLSKYQSEKNPKEKVAMGRKLDKLRETLKQGDEEINQYLRLSKMWKKDRSANPLYTHSTEPNIYTPPEEQPAILVTTYKPPAQEQEVKVEKVSASRQQRRSDARKHKKASQAIIRQVTTEQQRRSNRTHRDERHRTDTDTDDARRRGRMGGRCLIEEGGEGGSMPEPGPLAAADIQPDVPNHPDPAIDLDAIRNILLAKAGAKEAQESQEPQEDSQHEDGGRQ